MSENEDFFPDEDFLNDLDQTSQLYYSQLDNIGDNTSTNKRRKLNHENIENEILSSKFHGKKTNDKTSELSSRKNKIINIFENNSQPQTTITTQHSVLTPTQPTTSKFFVKKNSSHGNSKKAIENTMPSSYTKKLALEIIEKKKYSKFETKNKSPPKNQRLLRNESALSEVIQTDTTQTMNGFRQETQTTININDCSADLFKTPTPRQPKTLVRKFPGPAGLIPDGLKNQSSKVPLKDNLLDDAIYYFQNLNENEMNVTSPAETSHMSEYCSQETKKLFSDGAWRRMLDDLPKNFLRGYDIASLKRPGRPNKIPLLAAFIHRIEQNAENPRIILKDISNSIEAIMHKDIPTKYPNILQSGVVVLLRDIGVLHFQGAQKYSTVSLVMISPNSILGAYSDKERLVVTPALNEILQGDYDVEPLKIIDNTSENNSTALKLVNKNLSRSNHDKNKLNLQLKINQRENFMESTNPIENFDDISDLDFDEHINAFNQNHTDNSAISNSDNGKTIVTRAIIENKPNNLSIDNNSTGSTVPSIIDNDTTQNVCISDDGTIISPPTTGFADDLFNDTDDEILSQFDVDSIAYTHEDR
ncbi:hypothetical protein PV328_004484 [Microctonus aethiopoides]|uniref:Homologous recombination OB-fold protein OB-fold domain-containing protein n=1 Tax=Microctonus aethiopoides TaxID=144406 RepID=A0AA39FAL0_9HYME|nr:hypothetical protein PV328_004484 [Microctonus aethiopoides]